MFRIHKQPFSRMQWRFTDQISRKFGIFHTGLLLLFAVPLWLTTEMMVSQVAQAYTARVDLQIDRLPDESYENILRRAELAARAITQRSFDQDILVTEVSVIISAQNRGAIAPIFSLQVSRPQWQKRPDPKIWITYYKTARTLLSFDKDTPIIPETTVTTPTTPEDQPSSTQPTDNNNSEPQRPQIITPLRD